MSKYKNELGVGTIKEEVAAKIGGRASLDRAVHEGRVQAAPTDSGIVLYYLPRVRVGAKESYEQR
eukprot:8011876-Lingulodinium_polyedra.AAC.1